MALSNSAIRLSEAELRAVAEYAAVSALPALAIFECDRPDDLRARAAIQAARSFASGESRSKSLRDSAWAAQRAAIEARDEGLRAAYEAARAALAAAGAGFLHPLANPSQVKHILGAAGHAARAFEISAGDVPAVGADYLARSRLLASREVVDVLRRYPGPPPGGGRVGELTRQLDTLLR
ncbi:putative immunity protein [Bradyrhizobium oligotrophicum S58]